MIGGDSQQPLIPPILISLPVRRRPLRVACARSIVVMEDHQLEVEPPIGKACVGHKRGKKTSECQEKKEVQGRAKQKAKLPSVNNEQSSGLSDGKDGDFKKILVCEFDHCVENHFKAMDTIAKLCGEVEDSNGGVEESEIRRFSSSTTFLREWRYYNYESKTIKFTHQTRSPEGKDADIIVNLPQFSSAAVFKEAAPDRTTTSISLRDFVMYVGGPVWALDWCPQVYERTDSRIKCEFIAVSAHPPGSSYHKMGTPLTGRGLVQIWCVVNVTENLEVVPTNAPKGTLRPKKGEASSDLSSQPKRPRGRPPGPKNNGASLDMPSQSKRPRGRPKKKRVEESNDIIGDNCPTVQALSVVYPVGLLETDGTPKNSEENSDKRQNSISLEVPTCNFERKAGTHNHSGDMETLLCTENGEDGSAAIRLHVNAINEKSGEDVMICNNVSKNSLFEVSSNELSISDDVALPRVVLCLAHNGKVAWDLKWKPSNAKFKLRMGYLAVLLGNGSLEVWEVPCPRVMKAIYSTHNGEGRDPRFVKLEPVFRCSMLKSGNTQSIPLTVEWSTTPPHDYLLAGCHDGTVALWKFCANTPCKDTRPLLRFSADTTPIRGVAWAPNESDPESANLVLTAGHGRLKFWDLRDPFRPLWDLHPVPRIIYGLDWLPNPRCIILSFDDGTLRILSLFKAAYDVPVTGKPFTGKKQQGLHSYCCSTFAIWSVQVSRLTGMVAYCSADGAVLRFQLTTNAVEKDNSRYRTPHFLCGYLTEEQSAITINFPEPDIPFPFKTMSNKSGPPLSNRAILTDSIESNDGNHRTAAASTSGNETLALCYGNIESGSEDALMLIKCGNQIQSKCKKGVDNQALESIDEPTISQANTDISPSPADNFDVFPPKSVAMHKVRWNMNIGSERWLCSGGAAGILLCQEIVLSDLDKKLMLKK